jgi:tetrahydromethanopterin S-methyltransferase subunit G
MKETNKLLADFLGVELVWADYWNSWSIKNTFTLWEPCVDWNQLMQVIDKLKPMWKNESYGYEVSQLMDTPIGNSIEVIYEKVVTLIKLLMNESSINPE